MFLVNQSICIKKSNFNKNITHNSLNIYKYQVFLQPVFRKQIQYEK